MDDQKDILQTVEEVKEYTLRIHQHEKDIIFGVLNVYNSGFNRIGLIRLKGRPTEHVWTLLLVRCYHSLVCAMRMLFEGYYNQAITLIRSITEDILFCESCKDDERVTDVIVHDKDIILKPSDFRNKLPETYEIYRYQCKVAHSSFLLKSFLVNNEKMCAPVYDRQLFVLCVNEFLVAAVSMAKYIYELLESVKPVELEDYIAETTALIGDACDWVKKYSEDSDLTESAY